MRIHFPCLISALAALAQQQNYQPTDPSYKLSGEETQSLRAKTGALAQAVQKLKSRRVDDALLADVEVYLKAAQWIQRYPEEFFKKDYVASTLAVLDRGLERAGELEAGRPSWDKAKGRFSRAYRSQVDGSLQPYGMIVPENYDASRPDRLDVVLHGRGATLNEVSFLAAHDKAAPIPSNQDYLQVEVFGRTNNAYRWAGESDVFEAIESVRKRYNVDPTRIVLRGFSMGGAGTWHIGLHSPDRWAAIEAGAGFTETIRYAKQQNLPDYVRSMLHIYDAVDYSRNAFDVPTVGYGGEIDPQLQAAVNIREALTAEGYEFRRDGLDWRAVPHGGDLRALFLVGPQTPHRFHPESKKLSDVFINEAVAKRDTNPAEIRFVTYTERYNRCYWVTVDALERQYERAEVLAKRSADSKTLTVTTKNVARLVLPDPAAGQKVTIDGDTAEFQQHVHVAASNLLCEKKSGKWTIRDVLAGLDKETAPRKKRGLQGPIDDAFTAAFLVVRPTGKPLNPAASQYPQTALERFQAEFAKWLRGDIRVKDDTAVTTQDAAAYHLILFGDPGSNAYLRKVMDRLPLRWTKDSIEMNGKTHTAGEHVATMVYPNPLNPNHYVVINSGHTFHETEFKGTNALLYPRMGDYAVVETGSGKLVQGGLFNGAWKF